MMKHLRKSLFAALLLLAVSSSQAVEYNQLQIAQSALNFGYTQMGVPMEGKFGKFAAEISFDPEKLAAAHARIEVSLASIDTGSSDADEEVVGKKWFDAKTYPAATFVSSSVKSLGGNRYQAVGKLTIKGKTLDVTAPVTFKADGAHAVFDGSFNIKRLAYSIGTGEWVDVGTVADDIQIKFHLAVNAAPSTTKPLRK